MSTTRILKFTGADLRVTKLGVSSNVEVGTSNLFVDTDTGRVGVGTVAPTQALDVRGTISANDVSAGNVTATINETITKTTAHPREPAVLKKYPEVAFAEGKFATSGNATNSTYWAGHSTVVQGGYSVKTSHHSTDDGGQFGWHAFDDNPETIWKTAEDYDTSGNYDYGFTGVQSRLTDTNSTNHDGDHVIMGSPNKLKIAKVSVTCQSSNRRVVNYSVLGSDSTGTTGWTLLDSGSFGAQDACIATITSPTTHFKYHAFVVRSITPGVDGQRFQINSIHYYGYEDVDTNTTGDTSVDATVTSKYNTPDLTSASLYIDGKKSGSIPTNYGDSGITVTNNGTWDSSDNTWSLSGTTTSNIVSGNLGFKGDQPHSISAWVKADVLNGDGLFHVGTAEGEGDAASRVGFFDDSHISWGGEDHYFSNAAWHNVTYTYNGEGGEKKLYLDGRLVDTAKNEDTFGEYPPFDMSGYSEYGYIVSASNDYTSDSTSIRLAWNAFEEGGQPWMTEFDAFSRNSPYGAVTTGALQGVTITDTNGTSHFGHYNKLETPFKLQVGYLAVDASVDSRRPGNVAILGSNDDENWDLLYTNASVTDTQYNDFIVNSTKGYKYHMFMVKNLDPNGEGALYIDRLQYYGHRAGDLVRFPDSVNTLKYPHVVMTGPCTRTEYPNAAQRGYVASASSEYSPSYPPTNAFNDKLNTGTHTDNTWNSKASAYHTSDDGQYNGSDNFSTTVSGTAYAGEWIQIELPHKVVASALKLGSYSTSASSGRAPRAGTFAGSNNGSTWDLLKTFGGETSWTQGTLKSFAPDTNTTTAYKYFRFVITHVQVSNDGLAALQGFEVHGTESGHVIARVGDAFDGKVRNLRVYSAALPQDRVQEIFDADKDEFGLAKSSVNVYRGHLGVGTTEPKAALTVMDEVAELEEFPPRGFSTVGVPANTMSLEQHIEGHGMFRVSTSSNHGSAGRLSGAFDKKTNTYWHSEGTAYSGTDYSYPTTGTSSLAGIPGDWLRLELPYKVKLSSIGIRARDGFGNNNTANPGDQSPEDFTILGNNDNGIWTVIQSFTGKSWSDRRSTTIPITTGPEAYNSFAIVITKSANSSGLTIAELRYFGTREQGASTLHNGELSLTRNLTVPRIGPPLDADDTPRRDRLVVEYNTSTNPTENSLVKDTSGRGLDGQLDNTYGGAAYNPYYDVTEKALVFDGSNDFVFQNDVHLKTGVGGVYSASVWVKNRASSGTQTIYSLGTYAELTTSTLYVLDTTLQVVFYNSDLSVTHTIPKNTWTHIVVTHGGGKTSTTTKMYINGVDVGLAAASGTTYPLSTVNFPSPCNLFLGKNSDNSVYGGPMDLSNFKLWDAELTIDDVRRLYDMGRCDGGHHVVNFSKTQVGIGLGDGEAPRAELDVRGTARFENITGGFPTYNKTTFNEVTSATIPLYPERFSVHKIFVRGKFTSPTGDSTRTCRIRPKTEGNSAFMSGSMESWSHAHRKTSATTIRAVYDGTDGPLMFGADWTASGTTYSGTERVTGFSAEITVYNRFPNANRAQFMFECAHTTPYTGIEVVRGACQPISATDQLKNIIELSLVFTSSGGTGSAAASGECIICGLN